MSDRLDTFVRDALARGAAREQIREALIASGWPAAEVDAALGAWVDTPFGVPAPRRRVQTSAREAFLYLVMFATLYVVAFDVGALLFVWIERLLPDPMFYEQWSAGLRAVRGWTAAVLIAFPVFLLVARHIGGILRREPEKRASGVRRWLTYLTLFLAALVLIGNLMVLVSGLLAGELTLRFVLKCAVVFAIAGVVFGHYFAGMRREEADAPVASRSPGWLARGAAIAVVLVAGLGLWMSGSPVAARSHALDERRERDLGEIQAAVNQHYTRFAVLPDSLGALRGPNPGTRVPDLRDPVTGAPYTYRVMGPTRYELCATFDGASSKDPDARRAPARFGEFWRHPAGRACFTIDVPPRPGP